MKATLNDNVRHFSLLSDEQSAKLLGDTQTFVKAKFWEGCRGLQVTDEMRVTIAAQACLMLLGLDHDCFRKVRTILVYPSAFVIPDDEHSVDDPHPWAVTGQAVAQGPVILAWDSVLAEGRDPSMGSNLVIHEFAHQLDMLDGYLDGTLDMTTSAAQRWNAVLDSEFTRLQRDVRKGRATFLGDYAASNKTEFFAVASERFFTLPVDLRQIHPQLYSALATGYAIDPSQWFEKEMMKADRSMVH